MIITLLNSKHYTGSSKDTLNERLAKISLEDEDLTSEDVIESIEKLAGRGLIEIKEDEDYHGTLEQSILPYEYIDIPNGIIYELTEKGQSVVNLLTRLVKEDDVKVRKIVNTSMTISVYVVDFMKTVGKYILPVAEKILTGKLSK